MITTTQDSRDLALVTGASSGIGAAIADVLARRGTHLVVCARSEDALKAHAERWRACGVSVETVAADLTRLEDLEAVWAAALETARVRGLALTTVVNNAGFGAFGPDERIDEERLASMLRLNAEALMRLTHRAVSHMKPLGRGRVLNIASTTAFQSVPYLAHYSATKAYVLSYSEAINEELKGTGVAVTGYCPGPVRTNFGTAAGLREDSPFDRQAADVASVARAAVAAMDAGKPCAIYGLLNALVAFSTRLVPRRVATAIAGRLLVRMR